DAIRVVISRCRRLIVRDGLIAVDRAVVTGTHGDASTELAIEAQRSGPAVPAMAQSCDPARIRGGHEKRLAEAPVRHCLALAVGIRIPEIAVRRQVGVEVAPRS